MSDFSCNYCEAKRTLTYAEEEKIALDWIKVNPHTALVEVIKAHDKLICKCVFNDITPTVKRCYGKEFLEVPIRPFSTNQIINIEETE